MKKAIQGFGVAMIILLMAAAAFTFLAPRFGWSVDTVYSGSMEPQLQVGGVVVTRPVAAGEVTPLKARIVMRLPEGEDEASLVTAAMETSVADLRKLVKDGGANGPRYRSLRWSMNPEQQDRLDAALSLAKELEGYDAQEWRLLARIARDWLGSHAPGSEEGEPVGGDVLRSARTVRNQLASERSGGNRSPPPRGC